MNDMPMEIAAPRFSFDVICRDESGNEKWRETILNTVMTAGKTDMINQYFLGSAYTAAWFMGLVGGGGTIATTDTLASHPGWTELSGYTGNRAAVTFGTTLNGSNTALPVSFTIASGMTVLGAFLANAASGTSGVLYNAALFANSRQVIAGDTLTVTPTLSIS